MGKWRRVRFHPAFGLGEDGRRVTSSKEQTELSRRAAADGMVLLKNDGGVLPLKADSKVALFGKGHIDYIKGGGGSGDVIVRYTRNLYEGLKLKETEGKIQVLDTLSAFYQEEVRRQRQDGAAVGLSTEPEVPQALMERAQMFTDTAVLTISRFSAEGKDRSEKPEDGDYTLSTQERLLLEELTSRFAHVIVVLNIGGMMDLTPLRDNSRVEAVLLAWQAGMEGGLAIADVLCGDVNPSGKLTDTFATSYDAYPSSGNYRESEEYMEYTDDIFVGYRFFETIPGAADKVCYPFGYGLSYTTFAVSATSAEDDGKTVTVRVKVVNTGSVAGREVVQVYYQAPRGALDRPALALAAFGKTRLLQPGECQTVEMTFAVADMAAYDDTGRLQRSAWVLEAGDYALFVGTSVRNICRVDYSYTVSEPFGVVRPLTQKVAPTQLTKRLRADGSYEAVAPCQALSYQPVLHHNTAEKPAEQTKVTEVLAGNITMDQFLAQLTDEQLILHIGGQPNVGVADTSGIGNMWWDYGIPNVMTADGPAGLRISPDRELMATAWPCATLLACTWDTELVRRVGCAAAREIKENNLGIWLAPAMNIHRNPLCGRNFEYYSEDPLVAGKMASAMVEGIQSEHIAATVKHFACNNTEINRLQSDSRVSERALREIYLRGFEIVVREAKPWALMTSYNRINGLHPSENPELLRGILREEWGFEGLVMTDWWVRAAHDTELLGGTDVKMPDGHPDELRKALAEGRITRDHLEEAFGRILQMLFHLD